MQNAAGCCQEHLTGRLANWSRASPSMSSNQDQTFWAIPFSIKLGPRLVTVFLYFLKSLELKFYQVVIPKSKTSREFNFKISTKNAIIN